MGRRAGLWFRVDDLDLIRLRGIEVFAHHGVLASERQIGQRFVVDLDLEIDLGEAGATDALESTVDYSAVAIEVADLVASERWNLIEKVASRIAESVLTRAQVVAVTVTVHKPEAPIDLPFADVAAVIRRSR